MKVLEDAKIFSSPSDQQREALEAMGKAMSGSYSSAFGTLRKVLSGGGRRSAAFCVLYGKAGSHMLPWIIVEKAPGQAASKMKAARSAIKQVAAKKGKDVFYKGARFARGWVTCQDKRLVLYLSDGTVSPALLSKMFATPAPGLKKSANASVKKVLTLLREAEVLREGDEAPEPSATPAPDYADLSREELEEVFGAAEDASDLVDFTNDASTWLSVMDAAEQALEEDARTETADALRAAFNSSTDPDEQAELWLEYRQNMPQMTTELSVGAVASAEDWLDLHAPLIAEATRLRQTAQRSLDGRERMLSLMAPLVSQAQAGTLSADGQQEYRKLREQFLGYGQRYQSIQENFDEILGQLSDRLNL
jgi:hypothetical protein